MMNIFFFFLAICCVGCPALGSNNSSFLTAYFKEHDIQFSAATNGNSVLHLNGSLPFDVTVNFTTSEQSVIKSIPSVRIPANSAFIHAINVTLVPENAGLTVLNATPYCEGDVVNSSMANFAAAFLRISLPKEYGLMYFSDVIGWMYFVAWSVSFYPQTFLNYRRKSVIGLNFDFLALNVVGFFCYSLFNVGLYFIPKIQEDYFYRHPYGVNPVQLNDVIFSLHALFACLVQVVQCMIYEKGQQAISNVAKFILYTIGVLVFVSCIICLTSYLTWLDFLYFVSLIKLIITLIKYIPQVYYNHIRRSTSGWSIGNVLLDFTGGLLSILQMFVISYNFNDFGSIFGDFTKFGLGVISILFDIVFIVQHYILFKDVNYDRQPFYSPVSSYQENMVTDSTSSRTYGSISA